MNLSTYLWYYHIIELVINHCSIAWTCTLQVKKAIWGWKSYVFLNPCPIRYTEAHCFCFLLVPPLFIAPMCILSRSFFVNVGCDRMAAIWFPGKNQYLFDLLAIVNLVVIELTLETCVIPWFLKQDYEERAAIFGLGAFSRESWIRDWWVGRRWYPDGWECQFEDVGCEDLCFRSQVEGDVEEDILLPDQKTRQRCQLGFFIGWLRMFRSRSFCTERIMFFFLISHGQSTPVILSRPHSIVFL
jgi:hypothetical protein